MKRSLLGLALCLVASRAYSQERWRVINHSTATLYEIDTTRVRHLEDGTISVWARLVEIHVPSTEDDDGTRGLYHDLVDCDREKIALVTSIGYNRSGATIWNIDMSGTSPAWKDVPPGSLSEKVMRFVCKPKR